MDDEFKLAFTFAADATKQIITLSTAVLAFTVTFCKDFLGDRAYIAKPWLLGSWGCFVASNVFGILTLLALTGTLEKSVVDANVKLSIYNPNIATLSACQIFAFIAALVFAVIAGRKSLKAQDAAENPPKIVSPHSSE